LGGRECIEAEFVGLLTQGDFSLTQRDSSAGELWIIESRPI